MTNKNSDSIHTLILYKQIVSSCVHWNSRPQNELTTIHHQDEKFLCKAINKIKIYSKLINI